MKTLKQFPNASIFFIGAILLITSMIWSKSCERRGYPKSTESPGDTVDIYFEYAILDNDTIVIDVWSKSTELFEDPYSDDLTWEEIPRSPYYIDSILFIPHIINTQIQHTK